MSKSYSSSCIFKFKSFFHWIIFQTLLEEDQQSNKSSTRNTDGRIPPGFKLLSTIPSTSTHHSQSTDEGIESASIFESAHGDDVSESIYLECREDATLINQPIRKINKDNSQLEWRNQAHRFRPQWNNNNKVKSSSNSSKDHRGEKPRLQKPINLNKAPLSEEKKKNSKWTNAFLHLKYSSILFLSVPCKYAAGGNCKRGNFLRTKFIHSVRVYSRKSMSIYSCGLIIVQSYLLISFGTFLRLCNSSSRLTYSCAISIWSTASIVTLLFFYHSQWKFVCWSNEIWDFLPFFIFNKKHYFASNRWYSCDSLSPFVVFQIKIMVHRAIVHSFLSIDFALFRMRSNELLLNLVRVVNRSISLIVSYFQLNFDN